MEYDGENLWVIDSTAPKLWKVTNKGGQLEEPKPINEKILQLK